MATCGRWPSRSAAALTAPWSLPLSGISAPGRAASCGQRGRRRPTMDADQLRAAVKANLYRTTHTVCLRWDEVTGDLEIVHKEHEDEAPVMDVDGWVVRYDPQTGEVLSVHIPRTPD